MAAPNLAIGHEEEVEAESAPFLRVPDPTPQRGLGALLLSFTLSSNVLKMAMPVVLGMVTQTAINILDTLMVGRLPKVEANPGQAAIGLSLPFMWLVGGFLSAIWVGTQALTSRRAGEGNDKAAGRVLSNSLALAVSSSLVFTFAAVAVTPPLIRALYTDPAVVSYGIEYLQVRYFGILAMVGTFSYKSFFDGIGKTHLFMVAAVIMNVLNVLLNFALIYGYEPLAFPRLGVVGAAWASVIAATIGLLVLAFWSLRATYRKRYAYYSLKNLDSKTIRDILRLSLPNGGATIAVMIGFSAFYWVVGQVNDLFSPQGNPVIATANQIVITCLMPSFMTSLAFGSATAAMVSQSIGARRLDLAERYGWEAAKLWAYVMTLMGIVLFLFPDLVLGFATRDREVIAAARFPLQMMALPHGVIAIAGIMAQTLHGLGNAKFVMVVEFVLHFLVMSPVAYGCGVVLGYGLPGVWIGPLVYVASLGLITFIKFRSGDWKTIDI